MTRIHNAAFAAIAAACLAFPAFAQEEAPVARIRYADLDLATPAGQATLKKRVHWAITAACPDMRGSLSDMVLATRCRKDLQQKSDVQVAQLITPSQSQLALAQQH
jgi:UrcA family protein